MTSATAALRGPLRKRDSNLWQRKANDWYVEPEWCSRRLFEEEQFEGDLIDPACGMGRIPTAAAEAGLNAAGTDVEERWFSAANPCRGSRPSYARGDFLSSNWPPLNPAFWGRPQNIASNPPFAIAEAFVEKALKITERKVAMLLPANWVQGDKRSRWLQSTPLRRVYFITPRPSMPPGHVIAAGEKPGNGTTDYAWFVWLRGYDGAPEIRWLRRDPTPATAA